MNQWWFWNETNREEERLGTKKEEKQRRKKIEKTKRRSFWHSGYILIAFELGTDAWMNAI